MLRPSSRVMDTRAAQGAQEPGKFLQGGILVPVIGAEIGDRQAGAILQLPDFQAAFPGERLQKAIQIGQLPLEPLAGGFLGPGKILDAADVQEGGIPMAAGNAPDLLLAQAKLIAAGQPQQNGDPAPVLSGQAAEQLPLPHGFHGKGAHRRSGAHPLFHEAGVLDDPGDHQFFRRELLGMADPQLAGGANLKPVHGAAEMPEQEGVGLHRIAQETFSGRRLRSTAMRSSRVGMSKTYRGVW